MAVVVTTEPRRVVLRIENGPVARRQLEERLGVHDEGITRTERAERRRTAKAAWAATAAAMRKAGRTKRGEPNHDRN